MYTLVFNQMFSYTLKSIGLTLTKWVQNHNIRLQQHVKINYVLLTTKLKRKQKHYNIHTTHGRHIIMKFIQKLVLLSKNIGFTLLKF